MDPTTLSTMVETLEEMYKKLYTISKEASDDWVKANATELRVEARWLREQLEKDMVLGVPKPRPHFEL